jgi:hypothetical protein
MSSSAGGGGGSSGGGGDSFASARAAMTSDAAYSTPSTPSAPPGGGGRDDSPPTVSQAPIEVGIPDSESGFVDPLGTISAAPEVFDINVLGDPSLRGTESSIDPGFVRALDEQARRQADPVYGDPDPDVDVRPEDRDSITSFLDNYAANVASNPFEVGLIGALKTSYQTNKAREMMRGSPGYEFIDIANQRARDMGASDTERSQAVSNIVSQAPFAISGTTPTQSMVNQYFANLGMSQGSPLSSQLQTDYNNAKNSINSILGVNQQFGYSTDPYGGLMASNLATNPFNIPYMRTRGLI